MKFDWKLKDILMIAIIGVLFSILYQSMNYIGTAIGVALTPFGLGALGWEPVYGVWYMAGAFALYVIRKPGTGVIAEILAAVLEVLWGSMFGPAVIITGFIQGMGMEIGFALGRSKYDRKSLVYASITTALLSYLWETWSYAYYTLEPWMIVLKFVIRVISTLLFNAVITKLLADGLARAGVLGGYAIGQKVESYDED